MFALIESCPEQREGMGWSGKVVSLMAHAFIISAAMAASRHVMETTDPPVIRRDITWMSPVQPVPDTRLTGALTAPGLAPVVPLIAPIEIPRQIPPADPLVGQAWQPPGVEFPPGPITLTGTTLIAITTVPVDARIVEEQPELLSHPTLRYPEVLRQAGIEGRVLVEAVLDSLGHPEAGSLRVVSSAHPLFDPEALDVVQGSRYRPGRIAGRAVRVRVQVPVTFEIRR